MTAPPAAIGDVQPDGSLRRGQVVALLLAALPLVLVLQPYQWLSALGFRLQRAWPLGEGGGVLTGVLALQLEPVQQGPARSAALVSLDLKHQLARLPLLLLTHGASLAVGLESPSASLGASQLLALRARLAPLKRLPLPVLLATGAGGARPP